MRFSKKLKYGSAAMVLALACAVPGMKAYSQFAALSLNYKVHEIKKGKLVWIEGGGGNVTALIGDKGVILWDAKTDQPTGEQLIKEVAKLTPKPITDVVQTHSDCDHTNGLIAFPKSTRIIAHVNNAAEQDQLFQLGTVEVEGGYGLPIKDRLPNSIIHGTKTTATINGERMVFYYIAPSHTNGDLITYLPAYRTVIAGDVLFEKPQMGSVPSQDRGMVFKFEKGASVEGWFKNLEFLLTLDADTYVSGHGGIVTKPQIRQILSDMRTKMARADALAASGKSLDEIKVALGDDKYPETGRRLPGMSKICPRGIRIMPAFEVRWHEWYRQAHKLVAGR